MKLDQNTLAVSALVLAIGAFMVSYRLKQEPKETPAEVCRSLGGVFVNNLCSLAGESQKVGFSKDVACAENEFLAGIARDLSPLCRPLPSARPAEYTSGGSKLIGTEGRPFIGGWRMLGICRFGEDKKPSGGCAIQGYGEFQACDDDVLPLAMPVGAARVSLPVPCLEKARRCFVESDEGGKARGKIRSYLVCDRFRMLYLRL